MKTLFYLFCGLTIISGLIAVSSKNFVRSVFMFFLTLFCLAGLYIFAWADFVALTQIIVYIGGVLILMLFGLMLSEKKTLASIEHQFQSKDYKNKILNGVLCLGIFFSMLYFWSQTDIAKLSWMQKNPSIESRDIKYIGIELMTKYLLPFELSSVFLLMALVGIAYLSRKEEENV